MGNAQKRAARAREKAREARRQPPTIVQQAEARAARRTCGDCQACCTSMNIKALDKPRATRCPNQCAAGCAIYTDRPAECASYLCLWRQGWGTEEDRPDKLGVVIDMTQGIGLYQVAGGPPGGHPLRFTLVDPDAVVPAAVRVAMDSFLAKQQVVVLSYPDRQIVFGPRCPTGLTFPIEILDQIDARIAAAGKEDGLTRVTVIPQSDGIARIVFPEDSDADAVQGG